MTRHLTSEKNCSSIRGNVVQRDKIRAWGENGIAKRRINFNCHSFVSCVYRLRNFKWEFMYIGKVTNRISRKDRRGRCRGWRIKVIFAVSSPRRFMIVISRCIKPSRLHGGASFLLRLLTDRNATILNEKIDIKYMYITQHRYNELWDLIRNRNSFTIIARTC